MSVCKVSAVSEGQTHYLVTRLQYSSKNLKICWTSTVRLNVDSPLVYVKTERFEGSLLAK